MDPVGIVSNVVTFSVLIIRKLNEAKNLTEDAKTVSMLVRAVDSVVRNAAEEVHAGRLSQPSVIQAIKGVEAALARCHEVVSNITEKEKVSAFFNAGTYIADLKAISTDLANQLGVFQAALGIELNADTRKEFENVRKALVNMELTMLKSMEQHAASLRLAYDQQVARGVMDEGELRRVLVDCLASAGMGATSVSKKDMDEIVQELNRNKETQEAQYLQQIAALLQRVDLGDAAPGSCSSSPASTRLVIPPSICCPITLCIMRDPVMVETGHSYEREAIEHHLSVSCRDPVTNQILKSRQVVTNFGLRNTIQEWLAASSLTADQADVLQQQLEGPAALPVRLQGSRHPTAGQQSAVCRKDVSVRPAKKFWFYESNEVALLKASKEGDLATVQKLLQDPSVNPNVTSETGNTSLNLASRIGHLAIVKQLLAAGATVDVKCILLKWTALLEASYWGNTEVVAVLLSAGATVDARSKDGKTPLYLASENGHLAIVKQLLAARATVDFKGGPNEWTPLHLASYNGHTEVVVVLQAAGATVDARTKDSATPLYKASENGHVAVVNQLLAAGVTVDARTKAERTPLHQASLKGRTEVVVVLLAAGANVDAKDKDGDTPLDDAKKMGHTQVVKLLEDHKKKNRKGFLWLW